MRRRYRIATFYRDVYTGRNMADSIPDMVTSGDPLSDQAIDLLLGYKEEDLHVDYKETFHPDSDRDWLEITKDITAFANTEGGYLVFGVKSETYEMVGLEPEVVRALVDVDDIQQRINSHVEPDINLIRSKHFERDEHDVVVVFIPPSIGRTHMVSKDGTFTFPTGTKRTVLHKGTFYVRRSAGNDLADSRDLDDVAERRLELYRDSLLKNIARVVKAPQGSEVFVMSQDASAEPHSRFIIDNAPDAIPVKGMSFTISPETPEQEIAAWVALAEKEAQAIPPTARVWQWYERRESLHLSPEYRLKVATISLLTEVPVFFWLQGCNAEAIGLALRDASSRRPTVSHACGIMGAAAFLGKSAYKGMMGELGGLAERLGPKYRAFPSAGPRTLCGASTLGVGNVPKQELPVETCRQLEEELNAIAAGVREKAVAQPALRLRWRAQALDCYLYAQDDKY